MRRLISNLNIFKKLIYSSNGSGRNNCSSFLRDWKKWFKLYLIYLLKL